MRTLHFKNYDESASRPRPRSFYPKDETIRKHPINYKEKYKKVAFQQIARNCIKYSTSAKGLFIITTVVRSIKSLSFRITNLILVNIF